MDISRFIDIPFVVRKGLDYFKTADGAYAVDVKLPDEAVLKLEGTFRAADVQQESPKLFDVTENVFHSFQEAAFGERRARAIKVLKKCRSCDGYTFPHPWTPETFLRPFKFGSETIDAFTFLVRVAPFVCGHRVLKVMYFDQPAAYVDLNIDQSSVAVPRTRPAGPLMSMSLFSGVTVHPVDGTDELLTTSCDHKMALPLIEPLKRDQYGPFFDVHMAYHPREGESSWRCSTCYAHNVHFLSDQLKDLIAGPALMTSVRALPILRALGVFHAALAKVPFGKSFNICAWSDEAGAYFPDQPFKYTVTLVPDVKSADKIKSKTCFPAIVPLIRGPRSLAFWRILCAATVPTNYRFAIVNSHPSADWIEPTKVPVRKGFYSSGLMLQHASAGTILMDGGYLDIAWSERCNLLSAMAFADRYGVDELVLPRPIIVLGNRPGLHWQTCIRITPDVPAFELNVVQSWRKPHKFVRMVSVKRESLGLLESFLGQNRMRASHMKHLPEAGVFIELGVRDFGGVQRWIDQPACTHPRSYVITYVSFGTTGDRQPALGILKWLARRGFAVFHVPGCSPEEGKELLHASEKHALTKDQLAIWASAAAGLQTLPGMTLAPFYLFGARVPVTLAPPPYAIRTISFGLSTVGDHVMQSLVGKDFLMRIGSWDCLDNVPRSTDGENFDRQFYAPASKRPINALFAPGNTSENYDIPPGAVLIQPGDHMAQMKKAKILYFTGAGTGQSGAAAGCRCVALSSSADRDFVDRTNAGKDVRTGTWPGRVMAHLALADFDAFRTFWPVMTWSERAFLIQLFTRRNFFSLLLLAYRSLWYLGEIATLRKVVFGSSVLHTVWSTAMLSLGFSPIISHLLGVPLVYVAAHAWRYELLDLSFCFSVTIWVLYNAYLTTFGSLALTAGYSVPVSAVIGNGVDLTLRVFLPIIVSGVMAKPENARVNVQARVFWIFGVLPAFHVRLANAEGTKCAEGVFAGPVGEKVPYAQRIMEIDHLKEERDGYQWYNFATNMSWEDVEDAGLPVLRYSIFWNCHHLVMCTGRGSPAVLGAAMVPLGLVMIMSMVYGVMSVIFGVVALAISACLSIVLKGVGKGSESVLSTVFLHAGSEMLMVILTPGLGLLQKSLIILTEARFSWADTSVDGKLSARIFKLIDSDDFPEAAKTDPDLAALYIRTNLEVSVHPDILKSYFDLRMLLDRASKGKAPESKLQDPEQMFLSVFASSPFCPPDIFEMLCSWYVEEDPSADEVFGPVGDRTDAAIIACYLSDALSDISPPTWALNDDGEDCDLSTVIADLVFASSPGCFTIGDIDPILERQAVRVSGPALKLVNWLCEPAVQLEPEFLVPDISQEQIDSLGEVVARLVSEGADMEHALEATAVHFADSEQSSAWNNEDGSNVVDVVQAQLDKHQEAIRSMDRLTAWAWSLRVSLSDGGAPWWMPFEFMFQLVSRIVSELLKLILLLLSFLFRDVDLREAAGTAGQDALDISSRLKR